MAHIQLFRAYFEPKDSKKESINQTDEINRHIENREVINVDLNTSHLGNGHTEYIVSVLTKN